MKIDGSALDATQKNTLALLALFARFGFSRYQMSRFEEYDFYIKNKGFLVDDAVLTFTDTNGKLLALKPDVTLSIVKNADMARTRTQKLFYNESVYRVSKSTGAFKEIPQAGVECFGEVDSYHISEMLLLAAKSLAIFGERFLLEVSHIGIISALIRRITTDAKLERTIWKFAADKSMHSILELCAQNGIDPTLAEPLQSLLELSGAPAVVLPRLKQLAEAFGFEEEWQALQSTLSIFEGSDLEDKVLIDFSAAGNIHYYNGIIFNGFIEGVPESVLSGGQYDALMIKMKKSGRAIGFAVYLDLLERLSDDGGDFDADALLLYEADATAREIAAAVAKLQAGGKSVFAAGAHSGKCRAREVYTLEKGRVTLIENNA